MCTFSTWTAVIEMIPVVRDRKPKNRTKFDFGKRFFSLPCNGIKYQKAL